MCKISYIFSWMDGEMMMIRFMWVSQKSIVKVDVFLLLRVLDAP